MDMTNAINLIEELKAAAQGRADEMGKKLLELAERMQSLEQKGPALQDGRTSAPALSELVLKSPELAAMRDAQSKRLVRIAIKSFAPAFEQKAVTLISADAGNPAMRTSEIAATVAVPGRVAVRSLIPTRPTTAGSVDYVQVTVAGVAGAQVTEGSVKPQIDMDPTVVNAKVVTIAAWTSASKQVISDNLLLEDFIIGTLRDSLSNAEDAEILKGDGTTGRMNGVWTVATAYNRRIAGDDEITDLRRACTQVQLARGLPTGIVVSPEGLERLELRKTPEGAYMMAFAVDDFNRTVAWRTPVIVSSALGSSEFLVGDFARGARLYDREQATIEMSTEHADYFTRNLVAVLGEQRMALAVMRPTLFIKGAFA